MSVKIEAEITKKHATTFALVAVVAFILPLVASAPSGDQGHPLYEIDLGAGAGGDLDMSDHDIENVGHYGSSGWGSLDIRRSDINPGHIPFSGNTDWDDLDISKGDVDPGDVDLESLSTGTGLSGGSYDGTTGRTWSVAWEDADDLDSDGAVTVDTGDPDQDLESVLSEGNTAGSYDLDMSRGDIDDVRELGFHYDTTITSDSLGWMHYDVEGHSPLHSFDVDGSRKLRVRSDLITLYTDTDVQGDVTADAFYYDSDEELKEEIEGLEGSLEKVAELEGVSFEWKEDDGSREIGFVAQNVEEVYPELVTEGEDGLKSVDYGKLTAVLTEALNEQQDQIEGQERRINELERRLEELEDSE